MTVIEIFSYIINCKKRKSRSEEFHYGDSLMLLPHPCLSPHHPISGTLSCIWYTITCLVPHYPCLVSHHPYLVPHNPCLVPHLCLVSHLMTWTHPCLEPNHVSGTPSLCSIPSTVWYSTPVPHPHLAIAAPIWPLTALYPWSGPWLPTILNSCAIPPPLPQQLLSGPCAPCHPLPPCDLALLAVLPLPHLAPCHPPPALPLPATAIWPSCPLTSPPSPAVWHSWPQLPCPIWLPAIVSPAPTTTIPSGPLAPTPPNIITKGPLHPKRKFEFFQVSKFADVHFNLTLCGFNLISRENNIFHLVWKNSQNSREATPFPSIR